MILWATELPARVSATAADFLELAVAWLRGSPHLPWANVPIPDCPDADLVQADHEGQVVQVAKYSLDGAVWTGLRHTWTENDSREWTTELVAWQTPSGLRASVRLDCNLLLHEPSLPEPKKPYALKLLFTRMGGGQDGRFTVSDTPHLLHEAEVDVAAAIMRGEARCALPIVYVSAPFRGTDTLSADRLARTLSGMAHVVVEPSRYFALALARAVANRNPYGGVVGIFWPNQPGSGTRFRPAGYSSLRDCADAVAVSIREALALRRPTQELTWSYLAALIYRRRLDAIRTAGSAEVRKYAEEFDRELIENRRALEAAEKEVGRLRAEVARYAAAAARATQGYQEPDEPEYYPGEHLDAVLSTLQGALGALEQGSRRAHIVGKVIAANPVTGLSEEMADEVKRSFAATGDLGADQRAVLERLGFEIESDGRHHKVTYHGDGRYTFTISKTSSDHRAGKNLASTINRTLFK